MNQPTLIHQTQRRARAVGAPIAGTPLALTLLPRARTWSRPVVRLLRSLVGWLPVTWLAIVAIPILLLLTRLLGVARNDRIVLTIGLSGLAVTALCMLVVLATPVVVRKCCSSIVPAATSGRACLEQRGIPDWRPDKAFRTCCVCHQL